MLTSSLKYLKPIISQSQKSKLISELKENGYELFNSGSERGLSWVNYRTENVQVEIYRHYMSDTPKQWKVKVSIL